MEKSYSEQMAELSDDAAVLWEFMLKHDNREIGSGGQLEPRLQRAFHELMNAGLVERDPTDDRVVRLTKVARRMPAPLSDLPEGG